MPYFLTVTCRKCSDEIKEVEESEHPSEIDDICDDCAERESETMARDDDRQFWIAKGLA